MAGTRRCKCPDERRLAEAAVHFVHADLPIAGRESPEAGVRERFGEVAQVDGRVAVAFAGETRARRSGRTRPCR